MVRFNTEKCLQRKFSLLPSTSHQTRGCDQQLYLYQPISGGNGLTQETTANLEHEVQSLPISNNSAIYETIISSYQSVTVATNTPLCCNFSVPNASTSIQHIPVNAFNNVARAVGNLPIISSQYSGYTFHAILTETHAILFCRKQKLLLNSKYSNPAAVDNPFSGHSAVISQANVPLMYQWYLQTPM